MRGEQVRRKQIGTDDLIRVKGMRVRIKDIDRSGHFHMVRYELPDGTRKTISLSPTDKVTRYSE